jgi:hypothetical protein
VPAKDKKFNLTLSAFDTGQLLDGLRLRAEAWTKTADYLESGFNPDEAFICEECSDPREARRTAQHYKRIIMEIEQQVERQGGWA